MLPRIVVAARKNDALGRQLATAGGGASFTLDYCADRAALFAALGDEAPAGVVVGLRGGDSAAAVGLVRRVTSAFPALPVVVICLDAAAAGRDVLAAARAGAEHFAFAGLDDLSRILRQLAEGEAAPIHEPAAPGGGMTSGTGLQLSTLPRRQVERLRPAEYRTARTAMFLPPDLPTLLRRIIAACLGASAPGHVEELARRVGQPRRTLAREATRRGWPTLSALLQWGRLFRSAAAANDARLARKSWTEAQRMIAHAGGYRSIRSASRAFRARAGVGMRDVMRDGAAVLIPAFLEAVDRRPPPRRRLAS